MNCGDDRIFEPVSAHLEKGEAKSAYDARFLSAPDGGTKEFPLSSSGSSAFVSSPNYFRMRGGGDVLLERNSGLRGRLLALERDARERQGKLGEYEALLREARCENESLASRIVELEREKQVLYSRCVALSNQLDIIKGNGSSSAAKTVEQKLVEREPVLPKFSPLLSNANFVRNSPLRSTSLGIIRHAETSSKREQRHGDADMEEPDVDTDALTQLQISEPSKAVDERCVSLFATMASASPLRTRFAVLSTSEMRKLFTLLRGALRVRADDDTALLGALSNVARFDARCVERWLHDCALSQYSAAFLDAKVDGFALNFLTVNDLLAQPTEVPSAVRHATDSNANADLLSTLNLNLTNELHFLSLRHAIRALRMCRFEPTAFVRSSADDRDPDHDTLSTESGRDSTNGSDSLSGRTSLNSNVNPASDSVATGAASGVNETSRSTTRRVALERWTVSRVREWLAAIDLAEYAAQLRGSGVHGALMRREPRFTAELLSEIIGIPVEKTLLRRHLNLQFAELVGRHALDAKRRAQRDTLTKPLGVATKLRAVSAASGSTGASTNGSGGNSSHETKSKTKVKTKSQADGDAARLGSVFKRHSVSLFASFRRSRRPDNEPTVRSACATLDSEQLVCPLSDDEEAESESDDAASQRPLGSVLEQDTARDSADSSFTSQFNGAASATSTPAGVAAPSMPQRTRALHPDSIV